jgi:4-amino-4-deoxy-L-arabinose transferase-like glycosyltransferase
MATSIEHARPVEARTPSSAPRRWTFRLGRTRLALLALALLAYAPGFWWGAPHATGPDRTNAWGVDDEPPLGPLAQAHDIIKPKAEQNPNLGYPMLHPFLVLGSFTPYMGYLFATGRVSNPTVGYPHGFRDPVAALRDLTYIAHFLSVLLAVGIVLCAHETGRVLWDEASGIASAIGAMLMYPMFYYARNSNVDVPVLFFTALGLWAFAVIVRHGLTQRRALAFGVAVGLAVATKEPSFASFAFAPLVMLVLPNPGERGLPLRSGAFWRMALAGAAASLLAYALASGMVVDPRRWMAHIDFVRSRLTDLEVGGIAFVEFFPRTWAGHRDFAWRLTSLLADTLSWPGLVLGTGAMVAIARRRERDAILALSAVGYLAVLFFSARTAQLRYVMPAAFVLAIYAGRGVVLAWRGRGAARIPVLALAATAASLLAMWGLDLTAAMLRDSRYDAGRWIAERARPGDALEYFGSEHKNPPLPATLSSRQAIPFRGSMYRADTSAAVVRAIEEAWQTRQPRFIAIIPDYTNPGKPYTASCPPAIYRALEAGAIGYQRAGLFESPALLPFIRRPALDHPVVNPPIRIYERIASIGGDA